MDRQRLHTIVENPSELSGLDLAGLDELREKYPWFSSAHLLLALGELREEQIAAPEDLSRTAIAVPDRKVLFDGSRKEQATDQEETISKLTVEERSGEPEAVQPMVVVDSSEVEESTEVADSADELDELINQETSRGRVTLELLEKGLVDWDDATSRSNTDDTSVPIETIGDSVEEQKTVVDEPVSARSRMRFTDWLDQGANVMSTSGDIMQPTAGSVEAKRTDVEKKAEFYSPTRMAKRSLEDTEGLVTETLAKSYLQQGNTAKAIEAYRRLSLKYPDKSSYFAALIKEIEDKE